MSKLITLTIAVAVDRFIWWATPTALFLGYLGVIVFAYR